jgi:hypothetical protein
MISLWVILAGGNYDLNLNSQKHALLLSSVLSYRIVNTDSDTQSDIFGEGPSDISDLKAEAGIDKNI